MSQRDIASRQPTRRSAEQQALLEKRLRQRLQAASGVRVIPQHPDLERAPLSLAQQRLWFLEQMDPNQALYNIFRGTFLLGPLNAAALENSLNEIVRRHATLRTTFVATNGQPLQSIAPSLTLPLPLVDLSALSPAGAETEAHRLADQEAHRPFDLTQGPLLRTTLLHLSQDKHALLVTLHHIVFDGWSMGVLFRELNTLYSAFSAGQPSPLPDLTIQYSDFAVWQRQWLQGEVLETQLDYWKEQLGDEPPPLELPTDRPRPAEQHYQGAVLSLTLPLALSETLKTLGQREGVTLFMTLLAAFKTLLYRYTGQEDLCVGTYIANRNRVETEGLIGYFINTLVMRTSLADNPAFVELAARVHDTTSAAYAHQDLPFEKIIEALQPKRDLSRTPFFQVMLVLQNMPNRMPLDLLALTTRPMTLKRKRSNNFDLTLWAMEESHGLYLELEYDTTLFDAATVHRALAHLITLLQSIVAGPAQRLSELTILPPEERQQLLQNWTDTLAEPTADACFHHLFETQARQTPDAVVVAVETQTNGLTALLTYQQLNQRANQLARRLLALGVGPEVPVGLCTERSLEMIIGILGILKAGGAYLPLDPTYPQERLAFMLADAGAPVLLTQKRLVEALPEHRAVVLCLDADWATVAQETQENPAGRATVENLVYLIYTSGSTGKPKGTAIQHRSLASFVKTAIRQWQLTPTDRALQFASISWDTSAEEIYPTLAQGATLVLRTDSMIDSTSVFLQKCRDWAITTVNLPTAYWHELVANFEEENPSLPPTLRLVIIGGERALHERLVTWQKHIAPHIWLMNTYGATETTAITTMCALSARDGDPWNEVPIGRAIRHVQTHVLDRHLQPVPIGVPGELCIGGDGLARGYLGRPQTTAEKFIPHPFDCQAGARLYKTGDLARYLPDGHIEFLGRIDLQVKVRGVRVEPGEIETALIGHPAVRDAVVVAWEPAPGQKRLVAYTVPYRAAPSARELRGFLKTKLPDHWIPSAFVTLDALPLTPNGKVDRRALPAPATVRIEPEEAFVVPRGPVEEVLASIWAEVLSLEQIGAHDDFFELGGHSLLATQVVSRVRSAFRVDLALRSLFESPTVAGLAGRIETAIKAGQRQQTPPLLPVPRQAGRKYELSFAQQRLWFLEQLLPGTSAYHIAAALRLDGPLDALALEQTLGAITERHEALRASFMLVQDQPCQAIAASAATVIPLVDLSALPTPHRETEALRQANKDIQRPFDLTRGPLLRLTLLRLGQEDHALILTMHHIVSDDWSIGVFIRELTTFYRAYSAGQPALLPDLPVQYLDFAHWQRQWLRDEALETQLAYWKRQLANAPAALELPTDHPRPPMQTFRGARQSLLLPQPLSEALKALSRQAQSTLFMTLLATLQTLLHRYTGQDDIVVGSPIAGRNQAEIEGLIGFFVNTLVLRADLSGNPRFSELLSQVREVALQAYAHQDLPFEKLVEELQPERALNRNPLFQVMLVLQNAPRPDLELAGLTLRPMALERASTQFDLTLFVMDTGRGLLGAFEYNTDLFEAATIARLAGHLQTWLEGIAARPDRQIADLPLLTAAEEQQLLVAWNHTRRDYPQETCLHQLFEAHAARTPDAVAVVFEDERLTYRELDRRANQLAHYLQTLGLKTEVFVGLCMERSLEMVIALLGILKAGGAYLPLDPTHPQDRLDFILQDAHAPILLTQKRLAESLSQRDAQTTLEPDRRLICLDTAWETIARESDVQPGSQTHADNLAYIIYTSGSTGRPKGVQVPHRAVVNFLNAMRQRPGLTHQDVLLSVTTLSFDIAGLELFLPLTSGATVALTGHKVTTNGAGLRTLMTNLGATVMQATPATWQLLLEANWPGSPDLRILCGGEAFPRELAGRLVEKTPDLWNMYGPTETTIWSTTCPVEAGDGLVPIGQPIDNTQVYLLDRRLNPMPVGVPGELHIGGDGLARGYFNRPSLTAARFIPHPFSAGPGARLYETGDLARYLPDGNVEFLGRFDYQVKIRGFRIELGEIEAVMGQHPAVREVVVVAREDAPGQKRLVAYVAPRQKAILTVNEWRSFLKPSLPEYMIPSAFVTLEALPLTPNGKVDRRALPAPEGARPELAEAFAAPRTPTEDVLAGLWTKVLGLKKVGRNDNFFGLGGHSLAIVQLANRMRETFRVEIPLHTTYEATTIAELAALIEMARRTSPDRLTLPITPIPRDGPLALSHAQQQLWFLNQLPPDSPTHRDRARSSGSPLRKLSARLQSVLTPKTATNEPDGEGYNITASVRLAGALRVAALEQSLAEIVRRHEILRTTFPATDEWPAQRIAPVPVAALPLIDLKTLSEAEQMARVQQWVAQVGRQPFDLLHGPLWRAVLLELHREEHILLFSAHRIVCDDWSVEIFVREMAALYEAFSTGRPSPLPELAVQYADFAAWQQRWLPVEILETQLSYWQQQLGPGLPRLALPARMSQPVGQVSSSESQSFRLSPELTEALKTLSQREGEALSMTLLAAFKTLLRHHTGQTDIVVGTPVANRNRRELEEMLGLFDNILILRTDLSDAPTFVELLRRVRQVTLAAHEHQDLPFETLMEELQPGWAPSYPPLFQAMFEFQNKPMASFDLPGLTLNVTRVDGIGKKVDLKLSIKDTDHGLAGSLAYNAGALDAETIARLAAHFQTLLANIVADPTQRLSESTLVNRIGDPTAV